MKIVFYAARSGLGNNGGTRTMLLSAKILMGLGHDVRIVAVVDNFTYFAHPKCIDRIPRNTDIVIAASWWDVEEMHRMWGGSCAWWMRMWDTHKMPVEEIYRLSNVQPMFVNAEFMHRRLASVGIESTVIYQGIDFEKWYPTENRAGRNIIGTVRRNPPHYDTETFDALAGIMAAAHRGTALGFASIETAGESGMRSFYQSLHYYHAPQILGGLSNPPMEAALCGACVVCPRVEESGLSDYASNETALIYDRLEDVPDMIIGKDNSHRSENMQRVIREKIGDRKTNMKKFVKVLEKSL